MYGFKYESIRQKEALKETIRLFFETQEGPSLLEIFTPSTINDSVLLDYFKFIA